LRKIILQNLSIAFISKPIGFLSFIFIARSLSENDYGIYIYIIMIISLLPLLQLGSFHGTSILLPKHIANPNENEVELFVYSNIISHIIQFGAVFTLFLFDIDLNRLIILVIGANFFFSLYTQNALGYLNSNLEFQKANIIKAIEQLLKPSLVFVLFYFFRKIETIFIAQLIATFFILLISLYIVPLKKTSFDFRIFREKVATIYKIGFFVYLVWAIDIVFRTADRWIISEFYSLGELARYGFTSNLALNIWLIALIFCAPYSQVVFKLVAEDKYNDVKKVIIRTNNKLYLFTFVISLITIISYPFLLELVIKKYYGTELLFFTLVLSSLFLSFNTMYIYYMISNNAHFILLKYQLLTLTINIFLNFIFLIYHVNIIYYSYSTILSSVIYFILVRRFFYYSIQKKINIIQE